MAGSRVLIEPAISRSLRARRRSSRADAASPAPSQAYHPPGSREIDCRKRRRAWPYCPVCRAMVPPMRPGSALSGLRSAAVSRSPEGPGRVRLSADCWPPTPRAPRDTRSRGRSPRRRARARRWCRRRRAWRTDATFAQTPGATPRPGAGGLTGRANAPAIPRNPSAGPLRAGISQNQSIEPWISHTTSGSSAAPATAAVRSPSSSAGGVRGARPRPPRR